MRRFLCVIAMLLAVVRLHAAISETIVSLSITNPGEFLLAADALTNAAGTTRDSVHVRAVVRWNNDSLASASRQTEYQLQLLASNTAVRIVTHAPTTGTVYRFTNTVTVPGFGQVTRTNFFDLRPVDQLDPFLLHRVRLSLTETGSITKDVTNTLARQFWHFTNLISGDAAFNVLGAIETNSWSKVYAIDSLSSERSFEVTNTIRLLRYDDFNAAQDAADIPVRLTWQLQDTNGSVVPVFPTSTNFTVAVFNFENTTPREPRDRSIGRVITFRPLAQLDSVSNRYRLIVTMSLTNNPGQPAEVGNAFTNAPTRLLHFNGALLFGDISATITNLIGDVISPPTPPGSDYVNVQLDGRAILDANPERDFDLGGPRTFRLQEDGSAYLPSGSLSVFAQAGGDYFTNGNFRIRRFTVTLSPDGAVTDLRFYLPAGFGLTTNYAATRRFESEWTFQDIGLDEFLEPRSNLVANAGFLATTESKPVLILCERIHWSTSLNRFTLTPNGTFPVLATRAGDEALLLARSNLLTAPNLATKRANDSYYRYISGFAGNIIVSASSQGIAQFNFTAQFNDGTFQPHFPIGPTVVFTNGTIQIANNSVATGSASHLEGVSSVAQRYIANCVGCDGVPSTNAFSMTPSNRWLYFTRDGGLINVRAFGATIPQDLRWGFSTNSGVDAHRAVNVSDFAWHMPGHFVRGVDDTSGGENGPGVIHLTGVAATNLSVVERPYTSGYDNVGRADYGGFNIRSSPAGTSSGLDRITGTTVSFDRSARSKYYIRLAGVSGIHEATPGSFSANLTLLGYPFNFDNYGLAFRDNVNIESRTEGSVSVPYPAEITLPFEELKLKCSGGIESVLLPPGGIGYRRLSYWNADILPQSIRFEGKPGEECDPTQAYLVLGVQAHASYVSQPLSGTIGFFANGSLIPPAFDLPGVGSRFELPSQFRFAGPAGSGDWVLTPVSPAYFTTNDFSRATNGYLNFAGKINVPFFQDLKVHLHTGARTNGAPGNAEINLAGGWPGAGNPNVFGWSRNNEHYFNEADFDDVNRGFPDGVNIDLYHNSTDEYFRARAQRSWLEVVDFDYPLAWDPALRHFSSWKSVTSPLLVITAQHQVTYLDPKQAILDIG
ncbi:MAG TPA: hypothetical protein VK530_00290, partial [Candidatus Acidoferrum sp.]|nr:hypothetical protein [Candidatus Acidoferrum sp.]